MEVGSRASAVGVATSNGLDARGIGARVPVATRIFPSPRGPDKPSVQCVPWAPSTGVKQPWREADHSPPSNALVKKT
jgi:hypothetical protein